ncbi:hypothetical protein TARUN_6198, partial [Trichoderma arundinaceum]
PSGGVPNPDKTVTKIEDALQAGKGIDLSTLGLKEAFPRRPGYGTKGTEVILWANYVALTASPKLVLYRYDIGVTPAATGRKLTQIIHLLLEATELAPYKHDIVSDFKSTLVCRQKFGDQTIPVSYRSEGQEPCDGDPQYQIRLQLTNTLAASALIEYLTSTSPSAQYDDKLPLLQALNIFLNNYAKSSGNLAAVGSSKVFPLGEQSDTWDLGNCLVAIRGFFASVRAATARVLVNINPTHGAFFLEGPLDQFYVRLSGFQRNTFRQQAFLNRIRVRTTHLKAKVDKQGKAIPRIKTIFGFATGSDGNGLAHPPRVKAFGCGPKDVEFWLDVSPQKGQSQPSSTSVKKKKGGKAATASTSGQYISVYDFFVKEYNIRITDPRLPVVNVGNRENPVYLPLQVCHVLPGQPSNSKLDPTQTQQMIRFAVRRPMENATSIVTKGLQTTGLTPGTNPLLAQFGISISPDLITVPGRVLTSPKLGYGKNQQITTFGGNWNMTPKNAPSLKFSTCGSIQKWSCLYIEMPNDYPNAHRFSSTDLTNVVRSFHGVLNDTGVAAGVPLQPFQRLQLNGADDPQLDALMKRAASSLQLLFIILPATPILVYNRIKYLGDVKYGIHTVCSVGTKIVKPQGQDQYLRNLALKFNLKLGGNNQLVDAARLGFISEDKTMVVGIDVTHPSPGSSPEAPSIAGMVASVDRWLGQWPAILSIQPKRRDEMVAELDEMLKSRLHLWRQKGKHTAFPENIMVYRDGVSDGQYQKVLDEELPLLRAACKQVYPQADQKRGLPRFTIAIVGKRHHTRFYPTAVSDADNSGNTKPGTIVDRGVTEGRSWDFFLQAHAALQGTARPGHYYVVLDEIFRPRYAKSPGKNIADEFQDLTQSMCYVFGRATKAVSYCTPAYYADILCERARCYLSSFFETPSNSTAPSMAEGAEGGNLGAGASKQDVQIHERLRDTFYVLPTAMALFGRRARSPGRTAPAAAPVTNGNGTTTRRGWGFGRGRYHEPYTMHTRPTFGQWLKVTWLDILTMVAMGAIGLGIYEAKPAPTRSFAVTFSDGEIVWPEFGYPLRKEIIPIWLAAFLASVVPIVIILLMQIRIRSFWDVNNGVIGLLYSLISAAVFQVFLKWLIGGLRPHFLDVCKPDINRIKNQGLDRSGYLQIYYTRDICTGDPDEIDDSLESFPSGHTTAAFAGFVFLYLYLNAKLKVFSNYHPAMWKLVLLYAPILGAVLIGGALTIDEFHNWYDIIAGAIIGTVMAFSAYRMTYAAIWDWRFNHIPLNRGVAFPYTVGNGDLFDATFTRRVGWGTESFAGNNKVANGYGNNGYGYNNGAGAMNNGAGAVNNGAYANPTVPRRAVGGNTHAEHMV